MGILVGSQQSRSEAVLQGQRVVVPGEDYYPSCGYAELPDTLGERQDAIGRQMNNEFSLHSSFSIIKWPRIVQWSTDGSDILFSDVEEYPNKRVSIKAVDASGSRVRTIWAGDPSHDYLHGVNFDLSPNGIWIAYSTCEYRSQGLPGLPSDPSLRQMYYEIGIVDPESPGRQRVTWNRYDDYFPKWSPDGLKIAFLSSPRRGSGIWNVLGRVASIDNGRPGVITVIDPKDLGTRYEDGHYGVDMAYVPPVWSPDGSRVAFLLYESSPLRSEESLRGTTGQWLGGLYGYGVYTVGVDGSDLRRIAAGYNGVAWSPDGARLALVTVYGDDFGLVTVAADGSDPRMIMRVSGARERFDHPRMGNWLTPIAWSPDGRHILLRRGEQLFVVNLAGERVGALPLELADDVWPWESVDDEDQFQAAWSPDGSRIAVYGEFVAPLPVSGRRILQSEYFRQDARSIALFTMAPDGSDVRVLLKRRGRGGVLEVVGAG